MIESAKYYASHYGFAVMPVHGINLETKRCTCGKDSCNTPDSRGKVQAGKHPWTLNGFKNASNDPDVIDMLWRNKNYSNIGIATGPVSGIFVLDVDGMEGESSLATFPALPNTLTSYTGNGRHIVFKYPDRKVFTRAGKFAPGLDIRGEGGYIVAAPSVHSNGSVYQWIDDTAEIADAPEWLLEIVCRDKVNEPQAAPLFHPSTNNTNLNEKWSVDEVREMLSFLDPDCGNDDWVNIGMALNDEGHSLAIWDEWSRRGTKYKNGETVSRWKSFRPGGGITFGTLVHMAALSGWKPKVIADDEYSLENHPAREFLIKIGAIPGAQAPVTPSAILSLIDPIKLPGLVGDTVREVVNTSQKPQPELAMLNTIAALGAVFGRRYASPMDTRTNLYTVGIAVTASGKDHSRRFIKRLMVDAGLDSFIGSDTLVSGAGLLTDIFKKPSQVMHLDEFGMLLEAITDTRGAHYMKAASKAITEMYSSSAATFLGGQYADKKTDPIKIAAPNLCIYGTTTPDKYISSMNKTVIQSGELNRFIVLRPKIDRPERRRYMGGAKPSDALTQSWAEFLPEKPNHSLILPDTITVSWSGLEDRVWDMGIFEDAQISRSDTTGALWGRYRENVIKIAMVFSICRNKLVPIITHEDFDIAEAIVRQAIEYVSGMAEEHMSDSQHEKDCNDILQAVRKHGGDISQSVLCRATRRMDTKQREAALGSLMEQGSIVIETTGALTGRKGRIIKLIGHKDK